MIRFLSKTSLNAIELDLKDISLVLDVYIGRQSVFESKVGC